MSDIITRLRQRRLVLQKLKEVLDRDDHFAAGLRVTVEVGQNGPAISLDLIYRTGELLRFLVAATQESLQANEALARREVRDLCDELWIEPPTALQPREES